MPPKKHPSVDYLRVYPGLNDFTDALEAIPQSVIGHLTTLMELEAKQGKLNIELDAQVSKYFTPEFGERDTSALKEVESLVDRLLPNMVEKMQVASQAAENMARQIARLDADYQMICDHEVPLVIQQNPKDAAFLEIVPIEKQGTAKSQARREARESREARRQAHQESRQESRAGTPVHYNQNQISNQNHNQNQVPEVHSRRRGRYADRDREYRPEGYKNSAHETVDNLETDPEFDRTRDRAREQTEEQTQIPSEVQPQNQAIYAQQDAQMSTKPLPVQPQNQYYAEAIGFNQPNPTHVVPPTQGDPLRNQGGQVNQGSQVNLQNTTELGQYAHPENHALEKQEPSEHHDAVPPVVMPTNFQEPLEAGVKRKHGLPKPLSNEPTYCYCERASFGEMVGCDGPNCEREWFHLGCIGLSALPKGQWFCGECRAKLRRR